MADHIPFVSGEEGARLAKRIYGDSEIMRVPLDKAAKLIPLLPPKGKIWIDPCVDGMDDIETRRGNSWFDFMRGCTNFERVASPSFHGSPVRAEVVAFVDSVLSKCAAFGPAWITVPLLPLVDGAERNKINGLLAEATGVWRSKHSFQGKLILPLVLTHQKQANGKVARNPKVKSATRWHQDAHAEGVWIVDKSLTDDSGAGTLQKTRFPGMIAFHQEINVAMSSKLTVGGPYWGLNLVLWARGLVTHPAIGIGSGYQHFLAGGHAKQPAARVALTPLRRRANVGSLGAWLDVVLTRLGPGNPAHAHFLDIRNRLTMLNEPSAAREQVATFYKEWFNTLAAVPRAGRSMALFQDLAAAYALGKSLPALHEDGTSRRPEAVVEPLMMSCL